VVKKESDYKIVPYSGKDRLMESLSFLESTRNLLISRRSPVSSIDGFTGRWISPHALRSHPLVNGRHRAQALGPAAAQPSDLSWLATLSRSFIIAYISVMATAVASLLFSFGIRTVHFGSAIAATLIEGATAALLGVLLVGEALGTLQVAGIGLVLVSVWFNGRRSDPREMAPTG
jgi:hypothetical protein